MKKKIIKRIIILFSILAVVIPAIVFSVIQLEKYSVKYKGTIYASVDKQLIIRRNKSGIPEITVSEKSDIYFALGYLHAQDRKNSIIKYRNLANYSFDKIIDNNSDMKSFEEILNLIDIKNRSGEIYSSLSSENQKYLKRYSEGINQYLMSDKAMAKDISQWGIDDSLKIFILMEFANSFLKNNELIFPFNEEVYFKRREIVPDIYITRYKSEDKETVERLLNYRRLLKKYIGNTGYGFSFAKYNPETDFSTHGICIEGQVETYPIIYPAIININNSKSNIVTYSGLPFIYYKENGDSFITIQDAMLDNMMFVKREITDENGKYSYRYGFKKYDIIEKQVDENYYIRITEDGIVISDYNKVIKNDFIILMKYDIVDKELVDCYLNYTFHENYVIKGDYKNDTKKIISGNKNTLVVKFFGLNRSGIPNGNIFYERNIYESFINDEKIIELNAKENIYISGSFGCTEESYVKQRYWGNPIRFEKVKDKLITSENIEKFLLDTESVYYEQFYDKIKSYLSKIPLTSAKLSTFYLSGWDYNFNKDKISPSILEYLNTLLFYYIFYDEMDESEIAILMENDYLLSEKFLKILETGLSDNFDDKNTDEKYEDLAAIFDKTFITAMRVMHRNYGPRISEWEYSKVTEIQYQVPQIATKSYRKESTNSIGEKFTVFLTDYFYDFENEKISVRNATNYILYGDRGKSRIFLNYSISNEIMSKYKKPNDFKFYDTDTFEEKSDELLFISK